WQEPIPKASGKECSMNEASGYPRGASFHSSSEGTPCVQDRLQIGPTGDFVEASSGSLPGLLQTRSCLCRHILPSYCRRFVRHILGPVVTSPRDKRGCTSRRTNGSTLVPPWH